MDYNDELMGIIDKIHLNSGTKTTHDNHNSTKLIDFDVNQCEPVQQTASTSSTSSIASEEILKQNVYTS